VMGKPNVWVTINLHDLGDPHVLLYTGGEPAKIGLSIKKSEQARLIAADPFAAAEWFDTYCKSIIKFLFGGGKGQARGLFGTCEAYAAVKECYGRGSLHGHYVLWTSEITLLQTLLRNPVQRRRYESRIAAFVDSIVTCEVNAVPLHERTTEWCHPDAPNIADSQQHGDQVRLLDETTVRVLTSDDIGKKVKVSMRTTRKTTRTFDGTVRSVCADGWYSVERASSSSSQDGDPRIRGADIDHTEVQLRSAAGVPLGELRCPPPPILPPSEGDLPAFSPVFFGRAIAQQAARSPRATDSNGGSSSSSGSGSGDSGNSSSHDGSEHVALVEFATMEDGEAGKSTEDNHLESCCACQERWSRAENNVLDRLNLNTMSASELNGALKQRGLTGCRKKADSVRRLRHDVDHICAHCVSCGPCELRVPGSSLCGSCRAQTAAFMGPLLRDLGGLVVSGNQHGKRVRVAVPKHPDRAKEGTRILRRRCLRVCFKYAKNRMRGMCRLGYSAHGRLLAEFTHIGLDGKINPKRTAYHVVPHSIGSTMVLRCNNCVELLFTGRDANAVALYITSYMTKGELDSHNTFTILAAKEKDREQFAAPENENAVEATSEARYQSMVGRFVNALHGSIDVPAQYMATIVSGLPLEFTSHVCTPIYTFRTLKEADAVLRVPRTAKGPSTHSTNEPAPVEAAAAAEVADMEETKSTLAAGVDEGEEESVFDVFGAEEVRADGGAVCAADDVDSCSSYSAPPSPMKGADNWADEGGRDVASCDVNMEDVDCTQSTISDSSADDEDECDTDSDSNGGDNAAPAVQRGKAVVAAKKKKKKKKKTPMNVNAFIDFEVDVSGPDECAGDGDEARSDVDGDGNLEGLFASSQSDEASVPAPRHQRFKRLRHGRRRDNSVRLDSEDLELIADAAEAAEPQASSDIGADGFIVPDDDSEAVIDAAAEDGWASPTGDGGMFTGSSNDATDANVADDRAGASLGSGAVSTDGVGGAVLIENLDDYRLRVFPGDEVHLGDLSLVQFTLQVYKQKRHPSEPIDDLRGGKYRFNSAHRQSKHHVLVKRRDASNRVFVFIGPTAKPNEPEAFAQFVLVFFKPWHGPGGIRSLLHHDAIDGEVDDGGNDEQLYSSWVDALRSWSLEDRQASDPLWYKRGDGELSHPFLDHMLSMFEGEDRAREMAAEWKRMTHAERNDLSEFRGDASDDDDEGILDGDREYLRTVHQTNGIRYVRQKTAGRTVRHLLEEDAAKKQVSNFLVASKTSVAKISASALGLHGQPPDRADGTSPLSLTAAGLTVGPAGSVSCCVESDDEEDVRGGSAREHRTSAVVGLRSDLKRLVTRFRNTDLENAEAAAMPEGSSATNSTGQPSGRGYIFSEILCDLDTLSEDMEGNSRGGVDSSRAQYVPRSCLPNVDPLPLAFLGVDRFRGPTLVESIVAASCNPRQGLATFITGTDHVRLMRNPNDDARQLLLRGEPGVGKSRVALTFFKWLQRNNARETATGGSWTGKAASNIGQSTLHRGLSISVGKDNTGSNLAKKGQVCGPSKREKELATLFAPVSTFVHDEYSLTGAQLLWDTSSQMNKHKKLPSNAGRSFGNLNMLHCGDCYQKVGLQQPVYGDNICANDDDPSGRIKKLTKGGIDKVNKGRSEYKKITRTMSLVEQVRGASDVPYQTLNRHVRHGNGTPAMARTLNKRTIDAVTDIERDRLLTMLLRKYDHDPNAANERACIVSTRHCALDRFDQALMPLFAKQHGHRVVNMPSTTVLVEMGTKQRAMQMRRSKVSSKDIKGTWLDRLMDAHPTVLTANACGKVAKVTQFVVGASYRLWSNPSHLAELGACNGNLASAVGFIPHPDEPDKPADLRDDEPWDLLCPPQCLLLRLHDVKLLRGQRIGNLPFGVVPWFPETSTFSVTPEQLDGPWFRTQKQMGQPIANVYRLKRTGFMIKVRIVGLGLDL